MTWQLWIVVVLFATNVLLASLTIGPREDLTPGRAAFTAVMSALMIALIVWGSA